VVVKLQTCRGARFLSNLWIQSKWIVSKSSRNDSSRSVPAYRDRRALFTSPLRQKQWKRMQCQTASPYWKDWILEHWLKIGSYRLPFSRAIWTTSPWD
jgi:hypothetical protein